MSKTVSVILAVSFIGALAIACGAPSPAPGPVKEYSDPKTLIEVNNGGQFIIVLKSNPTTGYKWNPSFDQDVLKLVNSEYKQDEARPGMVGVGGVERFTFQALRVVRTEILMNYSRPFEKTAPIESHFFQVNIR